MDFPSRLDKQHLNSSQMRIIFEKLGFGQVKFEVDLDDFLGVEIFNKKLLYKAIDDLDKLDGWIIVFRVSAESRNFSETEYLNNHYVGIRFMRDDIGPFIQYADPTGVSIHDSVAKMIYSHPKLTHLDIYSSDLVLQYTNPSFDNGIFQLGGDDYDCGPLLAAVLILIESGVEGELKFGYTQSTQIGHMIREILEERDITRDDVINSIEKLRKSI